MTPQNSFVALVAALAFSAALLTAPVASAQSGRAPAGFITAVESPEKEGRPTAILKREGQPIDIQIWTSLFDGDVLEVTEGSVTIETSKDKRVIIDAARSPHRIEGELPTAGRFSAIASVIGDLFRQKPSRSAAALIGRTGAPELRIGGAETQNVVAGEPVWVAWIGGTAPFQIEVHGQSAQRNHDVRRLASVSSDAEAVFITIPKTASGDLTLIVRDAAGGEARRRLLTIEPVTFPAWIKQGAPTSEFELVARALYLLEDTSRSMDMLASTVAAQAGDYHAAVTLRALLAEGRRPE